jgi:deazaflavin-dependent oxidoreductase (nitroreductase family)
MPRTGAGQRRVERHLARLADNVTVDGGSEVDTMPAMPVHVSRKERVGLFLHRGLDKWLSPLGVWVMRRTKGSLAGRFRVDALVLTTVGRRSGRRRNVVLQFFPDGDAFIVTAVNGGDPKDPAWYLNLGSTPTAHVEVRGQTVDVRAEELPPDEATAWWGRILSRSPEYERYARATTRRIPVIRLVPVAPPA